MSGVVLLVHWLGVGFALLAVVVAAAVATARAYFATALLVAAASVLVALSLLCFGAGAAALAVALVGVGVVPVLMLGAVLLSARATRGAGKAGTPLLTAIAAALAALALLWSTLDATPVRGTLQAPLGLAAWLAALVFVAGLSCAGVLGYGERGALMRKSRGDA